MTDHTHPDLEHRIEVLEKDAMVKRLEAASPPQVTEVDCSMHDIIKHMRRSGHHEHANAVERCVAALRAELVKAEAAYDAQHKAHGVAAADRDALAKRLAEKQSALDCVCATAKELEYSRDRLAAQVEGLTRERERALQCHGDVPCGACITCLNGKLDRALAELAAANACLETSNGEARRLFEENKVIKADLAAERAAREKAELAANVNSDLAKKHFDWYKSYQTKLAKAADGIDALLAKINGGPPQKLKLPHIVAAGGLRALDDVYLAGEVHKVLAAHGIEFEITGLKPRT